MLVNVTREMNRARQVNRTKKCTTVTVRQMSEAEQAAMAIDDTEKTRRVIEGW